MTGSEGTDPQGRRRPRFSFSYELVKEQIGPGPDLIPRRTESSAGCPGPCFVVSREVLRRPVRRRPVGERLSKGSRLACQHGRDPRSPPRRTVAGRGLPGPAAAAFTRMRVCTPRLSGADQYPWERRTGVRDRLALADARVRPGSPAGGAGRQRHAGDVGVASTRGWASRG